MATDASGESQLVIPFPAAVAGAFYMQAWILDPAAPLGLSASNGLQLLAR